MCNGTTTLRGVLNSEDTDVMLNALDKLGVQVSREGDVVTVISSGAPFCDGRNTSLFLGLPPMMSVANFICLQVTLELLCVL